jgi:hypothetical protein
MADDYNLFDNADSQNTESKNENQDINELLDRAEKQKQDESQDLIEILETSSSSDDQIPI